MNPLLPYGKPLRVYSKERDVRSCQGEVKFVLHPTENRYIAYRTSTIYAQAFFSSKSTRECHQAARDYSYTMIISSDKYEIFGCHGYQRKQTQLVP